MKELGRDCEPRDPPGTQIDRRTQTRVERQKKDLTGAAAWTTIHLAREDDDMALDMENAEESGDDFLEQRRKALLAPGKGKSGDNQPEPRIKQDCTPPSPSPCPLLRFPFHSHDYIQWCVQGRTVFNNHLTYSRVNASSSEATCIARTTLTIPNTSIALAPLPLPPILNAPAARQCI